MRVRPATPEDWQAMARLVAACFEEYQAFAHRGWIPPSAEQELRHLDERLRGAGAWARVATDDRGDVRAHLALHDAPDEPGVLHLMHLFLAPEARGTGLAKRLLDDAVAHAAAVGAAQLRLNTPEGQARARAFYLREGWEEARRYEVASFGLPLVEYRRRPSLVRVGGHDDEHRRQRAGGHDEEQQEGKTIAHGPEGTRGGASHVAR